MAGPIAGPNPVIKEILDALGLKNVTKFEMKMEVNSIVAVNVTYFPEEDGLKQFPAILTKYELIDKREAEQLREDSSELTRRIARAVFEEKIA